MPRFSILIPVYNVERYLDSCLQSVLRQSLTDCEVIVVDDGSTDGSGDMLEGFREAFAQRGMAYTIIHQDNQGLSGARNTALEHCRGEYILFLDSDDMLHPDALARIDSHLHGEDMLCFNGQRFHEETGMYEPPENLVRETGLSGWQYYCSHALEKRNFAFVCVVLRCYRRAYLMECGLCFREGIYHEDNLFTPQACYYAKSVTVIPDVLYDYRVRPGSIMTNVNPAKRADMIRVANELYTLFSTHTDIDLTVLYRALTHHYQVAFEDGNHEGDRQLLVLVDWNAYHTVSRTKVRHRLGYAAIRISPRLFRLILKIGL